MAVHYLISVNSRGIHLLCSCNSGAVDPRTNSLLNPSSLYTESKSVPIRLEVVEVLVACKWSRVRLQLTSTSVTYRRENNIYCGRQKPLLWAINGRFVIKETESILFLNNTEQKNLNSYSPSPWSGTLATSRFHIFTVPTFGLTSRICGAQQMFSIKRVWASSIPSDMPRKAIYSACIRKINVRRGSDTVSSSD